MRRHELAFGILVLALLTGVVRAEEASERDTDSPSESLELGASIEVAYERQQNLDLDSAQKDGVDLLGVEAVLEILFAPNDYFDIYLQPNLTREFELREQGEGEDRNTEFSLEEAFFTLRDPERGLSLEVGRTFFADEREWV
ncbi:MAG: hypothetical protein OEM59_09360, partial [Rhodospirillales bacterium]|nr:hypothetical protein [Rhodospirillales bacterium]